MVLIVLDSFSSGHDSHWPQAKPAGFEIIAAERAKHHSRDGRISAAGTCAMQKGHDVAVLIIRQDIRDE